MVKVLSNKFYDIIKNKQLKSNHNITTNVKINGRVTNTLYIYSELEVFKN